MRDDKGRWLSGASGNPRGRPCNPIKQHLSDNAPALIQKAVELALAGDSAALKLCIDRLSPALRPTAAPVSVEIPEGASLTDTGRAIVGAAASGQIPADLAAQMVGAVASLARIAELDELLERIEKLEAAAND